MLLSEDSYVDLSVKEVRFCFGMSKMTVKNEFTQYEEYDKLRYVEFLEFIGRVAAMRYPDDSMTISEKIILILDMILPCYDLKRVKKESKEETDLSSEESVILTEQDAKSHEPIDRLEYFCFKTAAEFD